VIVALGCGTPDEIPLGAVRALVDAGRADIRASDAVREALVALGCVHDPSAAVIGAPDPDAWRLACAAPQRATLPGRDALQARACTQALEALWRVTARLRRDCPWDREQTAATIVTHTLEEVYELADKALSGPPDAAFVDELGDLLFQTYFLAVLADEAGAGDLARVADGIREKLVRRHPHVFGQARAATATQVVQRWEQVKRDQEGREGIFHDVPAALPALLFARKLQRRAAAVGFDWATWQDAWPVIAAELDELSEALGKPGATGGVEPAAGVVDEAGDVLFAVVNVFRLASVDPELALRRSARRFQSRVELAERLADGDGATFSALGLDAQDRYYRRAKEMMVT
jgi:MazG family protein